MSKVYSFRLNDDNPREIQAREVIEAWISKGFSLRQAIVESLLATSNDDNSGKDVSQLIKKVEMLLEKVDQGSISLGSHEKINKSLPPAFIDAISETIKRGEKLV